MIKEVVVFTFLFVFINNEVDCQNWYDVLANKEFAVDGEQTSKNSKHNVAVVIQQSIVLNKDMPVGNRGFQHSINLKAELKYFFANNKDSSKESKVSKSKDNFIGKSVFVNYQNLDDEYLNSIIESVCKYLTDSSESKELNQYIEENKSLLKYLFVTQIRKSVETLPVISEDLENQLAGHLKVKRFSFKGYSSEEGKSYLNRKKFMDEKKVDKTSEFELFLDSIGVIIKDNKLIITEICVKDKEGKNFKSYGTTLFPISLSNSLDLQFFKVYDYDEKIFAWIRLSDLIEYVPPKNALNWGFNVETVGNASLIPGEVVDVKRKKLPDLFNVTGFYHWYKILDKPEQETAEKEKTGESNAQIELNINLPLWDKTYTIWQFFNKANFMCNFSPLARGTSYYLLDVSDSASSINNPIRPFEITRKYFINSALTMNFVQINALQKSWLHSFNFSGGLNHFTTKVRKNDIVDTVSAKRLVDFENSIHVSQIGPVVELEYTNKWNDILGFSLKGGMKFLKTTFGENLLLQKYLGSNKYPTELANKNWAYIYNLELNVFLMPFSKITNSSSGVIFRYRFWDDINSNADLHHEFMIGYALNINTLLK